MRVYFRVFMSSIVIQDHMDVFPFGNLPLDESQKLEEFLMAMLGLTLANYSPLGHIEGSKKTGGSIPLIIMGVPFHLPGPKGQQRLNSIQSLNLALFVNRKHQRILWRVEIQSDNVNNLGNQLRVVAIFKGLCPVRLKFHPLPDTLNSHMADIHLFSQRAGTPMCGIFGLAEGGSHDLLNPLFGNGGRTAWFRGILQSIKSVFQESPLPKDNRGPGSMKSPGYRRITFPLGGGKDDIGSQNHLLGSVVTTHQTKQFLFLLRREFNSRFLNSLFHKHTITLPSHLYQLIIVTKH